MQTQIDNDKISGKLFWYYAAGVILAWTLFVALTLLWHQNTLKQNSVEAARIESRKIFQNHVIYRSWNSSHGGVYAKVTQATRPNPHLDVPEREITTSSGTLLTKINPAYMTRQANELAFKKFGTISHITSLNPIRPENKPDAWETGALKRFNTGSREISAIKTINDRDYMRLMQPLITEKACLQCHAKQGYKEGDIRGGISVSIPLAPYYAISMGGFKNLLFMYTALWLAGIMITIAFMYVLSRQVQKRLSAEHELNRREKLEGVVEMARAVCHELNQPLQTILGNAEIMLLEDTDKKTLIKRAKRIKEQVDRMGSLSRKLIKISNYETKEFPQGRVIDIDKSSKD